MGSKVKVIQDQIWKKNLLVQYLTRELKGIHQTWHSNTIWRVDELIRYSRAWVNVQGHMGSNTKSMFLWYLSRELGELYKTWPDNSLWRVDNLLRNSKSWGQRSRGHLVNVCVQYTGPTMTKDRIHLFMKVAVSNFRGQNDKGEGWAGRGIWAMFVSKAQHYLSKSNCRH